MISVYMNLLFLVKCIDRVTKNRNDNALFLLFLFHILIWNEQVFTLLGRK